MPITNASLIADLRLATALDAALRVILHDQMSLRTTGSILNLGSINGTGSAASTIRYAGLDGFDSFAAVGEVATVAETAFTTASAQIAVGRCALRRDLSDLAQITGLSQDVDPMRLAQSMVGGYEQYFNTLVAGAVNTFTTVVGTAATDMTVDDFYDAVYALEIASANPGFVTLLSPDQLANFQESLRAEGGAAQYMAATADMLQAKGQGYQGSFLGVDIYKSDKVIIDGGGDAHGGMWAAGGAMGYKTGSAAAPMGGTVVSPGGEITVEFERVAAAATTQIIGTGYLGLSVLEDAQGVQIRTDGP